MRYKALLLVMIVVGTSLLILASAPSEVKAAPHDPIFIESDAELESMAVTEGWAGSGSAVDPFIIEDYVIDANNATNGIRIRNIDHHIVIRNCVVHNTSDDVYIPSGDGIYLASVENATIEGCEVYDTYDGIGLYECKDILVKGNVLHDNRNNGVDVGKGSGIRVTENTCSNNSFSGIYIWLQSSACRVDNNTCDLSDVGITINSSPNNLLEDNYCHQNHDGISLIASDGSNLRDNNCSDNEGTGFQIRSDDVAMSGDTGTNNTIAIDIQDATDVLIENVNFTANHYALFGTQLNGITVRGGNFSFNVQPGIYLTFSKNISTDGNRLYKNNNNGIYLDTCTDSQLGADWAKGNSVNGMMLTQCTNVTAGPTCVANAQNGVRMDDCFDCHIMSGDLSSNTQNGVRVFSSDQCSVMDCELSNNDVGIAIVSSSEINVDGNIIIDCNTGIYSESSSKDTISKNRLASCFNGIWVFLSDYEIIQGNNVTDSASYGISLEDCSDVQVYGNALIDNNGASNTYDVSHIQASDSSATANHWNSTGTPGDYGNLWSDWLTPDADLDGFVDAPYPLAGGAQDNAPLADASAPELQILTPTNLGALNAQYALITWQGWDNGSGIVGYGLSFDGASTWVNVGTNTSYLWDPISEGIHQIKVNATDRAGLYTVVSVLFYMDRTAPVVTFLSPANFTHTNQSVAVVTWSGSDATTAVDHYKVRINDHPWTSTNDTTFTTPAMTESWNQVWINATDTVGNWAIFYLQIFVDTEGPQIEIVSPANGILVGESSVNIVWTIEDLGEGVELCEISIDAGPWTNVTGVTSYIASGLTEGPHTVQIQAMDGLGNKASTGISFGVDLYAPTVSITSPDNNTVISSGSILLQWTGSDSSGFGVDRYEVQIDSGTWNDRGKDTSWTIIGLLEGEHTLRVRAFDNLGRNTTDLVVVVSDDEGPSIGIDNIAERQTLTITNINVTWTAFDSGSDIARFEVRLDAGEWQDRGLEQWALLELTEGMHNLTVRGYDQLGNIGQDMVNFSVDVSAPIVEINYPSEGAVINNKTVQVFYRVSDPSGIRWLNYTLDGVNWTRVNYPSDHVTLNVSDGPVHFALKAIDLVGWERTAWSNFTLDSSAPAVTAYSPKGTSVPTGSSISVSLNEDIQSGSLKILVDGVEQAYTVSGRTYNVSIALVLGHTYTISAQGGTDIAGNRMGNFTWTFSTPTTGTITGRVVDSEGDPIVDAYIRAGTFSTVTNFQGVFQLDLPPGSYNLTITVSGMEDKTVPIEVDGDIPLGDLTMDPSPGGMDTWLIGAILAVIAVVAIAAFLFMRKRKG